MYMWYNVNFISKLNMINVDIFSGITDYQQWYRLIVNNNNHVNIFKMWHTDIWYAKRLTKTVAYYCSESKLFCICTVGFMSFQLNENLFWVCYSLNSNLLWMINCNYLFITYWCNLILYLKLKPSKDVHCKNSFCMSSCCSPCLCCFVLFYLLFVLLRFVFFLLYLHSPI